VNEVAPLHRTLEQELLALLRGASLECPVCGEFVLHRRAEICCPECGLRLEREVGSGEPRLQLDSQAG
jgi:rubrerythrin